MLILLAKLLVAPSFVVAVSLVARRFGPQVAGLLAALPVVGGPILALIVVEQGADFGRTAALSGAIGAAATMGFAWLYARLAHRLAVAWNLAASYAAYSVGIALTTLVPVHWVTAALLPGLVWGVCLWTFPHPRAPVVRSPPPSWDLPVRAVATMSLVVLVTSLARLLGPSLAGLVTPIPIATAVLAASSHRVDGPDAAIELLYGLVRGLASFTSFFVITGLMLPRGSAPLALGAGLAFALVVQALVVRSGIGARVTRHAVAPTP